MIPTQTSQVLLGTAAALLYASAILAIGVLSMGVLLGRQRSATVCARIGPVGFVWLGFVIGQGILGVVWLVLALAGILYSWLIWIVCTLGWSLGYVAFLLYRRQIAQAVRALWSGFLPILHDRSWYFWVGSGVVVVVLFRGVIALLPTGNDDALRWYLAVVKVIAFGHTLEFQPFVTPHNGLYPMQVEMHWAALFTISNETAVAVWDYLCALSFLCGIGYLTWSLTSSRRAALLAVLMMLSTPGFYQLMGGGKVDNAAAQYSMAAFLCLVLWPILGQRSVILAGLYVGWAMAARYTNFIVLPALIVFAVLVAYRTWGPIQIKRFWLINALVGGTAAGVAGMPMLIKNYLLVGCPLAPHFGCQGTFWASIYWDPRQNLSVVDLLLYPFVWTFAQRADMYGNISPLYLGFFPFLLLAYPHFPYMRPASIAGLAALVSITTWLLIEPLILFTRWLLVPLGLLAVPLSASVTAIGRDRHHTQTLRWLVKSAIFIVLLLLLFQSRGVVYGIRYLASMDSRAARYESMPDAAYDVSTWLNAHVRPGQRVALNNWGGYRYFLRSDILLNSESIEEFQWLWEHQGSLFPSDFCHYYARNGFTYVVVTEDRVNSAKAVCPNNIELSVAFVGRSNVVLRLGSG